MRRLQMPLLLVLVYGALAAIIFAGATVVPRFIEGPAENNYFLTGSREVISSRQELAIARDCKQYLEKLEQDFYRDLEELGRSAYREYRARKEENPDASPYSLAGKYLKKLRKLEDTYDARFRDYLENMENKLEARSLSTELAGKAEYAYREQKREIKSEFKDRARELLSK